MAALRYTRSPSLRIHSDGPRLAQLGADQHVSPASIRGGHRDGSVARVGPVEVMVDPVQSQTLRGMQIRIDQGNVARRVACFVDVRTVERENTRDESHSMIVISSEEAIYSLIFNDSSRFEESLTTATVVDGM